MTIIALNRRFCEWKDDAPSIARIRVAAGLSDGMLGWSDLLQKRRVVLLAEAGSGKTSEMREQARRTSTEGKFAFYATVQDVGRDGLEQALLPIERQRLQAWHQGNDSAWFFIDSVDEAKLNRVSLERALRALATALSGAEGRAHIILSGRHTDWEFTRDLRRFNDTLPIPLEASIEPTPSLEILVQRILDHEEKSEPVSPESPIVVLMDALTDEQIELYIKARSVRDPEKFIADIRRSNLLTIARRPLDLDWIVQYWNTHGCLGKYAEMIESSLRERLRETDPERGRVSNLAHDHTMEALERIGAALVFTRRSAIAIPDNDAPHENDFSLIRLDAVLSDWSDEERLQLLTRPAFDPATFGRARLHNDNEEEVRAYLAARWLLRLRKGNLSERHLHELIFARIYERDVIKPSMLRTAAWLSIWDEGVAAEFIRREPFLLFTIGDAASLTINTRRSLLKATIEEIKNGAELPMITLGVLIRFAQPDIALSIREHWESNATHMEIRQFLLRLIWAGELRECADLVSTQAFGQISDRYTAITAGRALLEIADEKLLDSYAEYIKQNYQSLDPVIVSDAIESLFPQRITVDNLLAMIAAISWDEDQSGWQGAELVQRLTQTADIEQLIEGLLRHLGPPPQDPYARRANSREKFYTPTLAAAAKRLLDLSLPDVAPTAAIDAVLRICDHRSNAIGHNYKKAEKAVSALHTTSSRRRAAFWRAAERFISASKTGNSNNFAPRHVHQLAHLGWSPGLIIEDIDWLLLDSPIRACAIERELAINSALLTWKSAGESEEIKKTIADVASKDPIMQSTYESCMQPYVKSAAEIESENRFAEITRKQNEQRERDVQAWVDFLEAMKSNPEQLRNPQIEADSVDRNLYDLWQMLHETQRGNSRYAVASVAPLATIAGDDVAQAFADGLSQMWRTWKPTVQSERAPAERNQVFNVDCMGLAGVSIEASSDVNWASKLTSAQALRAAEYLTLEINGFPDWTTALIETWPVELESVLSKEIADDLNHGTEVIHYQTLEYVRHFDDALSRLMAPACYKELQNRNQLNSLALRSLLPIVVKGLPQNERESLYQLAIERFTSSSDVQIRAQYLGAAYTVDSKRATQKLIDQLKPLTEVEKTLLVERVLPQIFGSRWSMTPTVDTVFDPTVLEFLVVLAYRTIKVEEDRDHANGKAYSPDDRDKAESARSTAFNTLVNTPGGDAFDAILRLMNVPNFPVPRSRLEALAQSRAAQDAESSTWAATDLVLFEQQSERAPATNLELQRILLHRLEDLQHELIHGDFQQGKTLAELADETAVQNWIADRLRHLQRNAYSVEREVHVAQEKEPDIRCRAKASDSHVSIEIKVAESWSLNELEEALINQLCGQYLRARDGRHGILLLVHQKPRAQGWELPDGSYLSFAELCNHLISKAEEIRRATSSGPQPEIFVIDVSSCLPPPTQKKRGRPPKKKATTA